MKKVQIVAKTIVPISIALLLAVAANLVWMVFCEKEKANDMLFLQWEVERLAEEVIRTNEKGVLVEEGLPDPINAVGIYNSLGLPMVLLGFAPGQIVPPATWDGRPLLYSLPKGEKEFYRGLNFRIHVGLNSETEETAGFLYLKMRGDRWSGKENYWATVFLGGAGLIFAFWVVVLWVYFLVRKYKSRAEENLEMAQYSWAAKMLAHEIKNPLASILLQGSLLSEKGSDEARIINEEVARISRLVDRMKDFLRRNSGKKVTVNAWEFAEGISKKMGFSVVLIPQADPGWQLRTDTELLRSALENVLKNAKEADDGDPRLTIKLEKRRLFFCVEDEGPGIGPETMGKIFQPFFTTKEGGTGLGLLITRQFIKTLGGDLVLENRKPKGLTVSWSLPLE